MTSLQEINALVAEHVFGYTIKRFDFEYDGMTKACEVWISDGGYRRNPRPFASDISAAFQVIERMRESGFDIELTADIGNDDAWRCLLTGHSVPNPLANGGCGDAGEHYYAHTDRSLPRAICLAALAADGIDIAPLRPDGGRV
jgi:Phage ABA sandwich domain